MVATPFRTSPALGPELTQVIPGATGSAWYDMPVDTYASTAPKIASPQLGTVEVGSDGRPYMWVKASGAITAAAAPGTQVAITVGGYNNVTAAAGSGGWYAPPSTVYASNLAAGDCFWAAKGTAP